MDSWVLGIDSCPKGWIGICWSGMDLFAVFGPTIELTVGIAAHQVDIDVIAVDMPIGLPDRTTRIADQLARNVVGARRSSVFNTPIRLALEASTREEASIISKRLTGMGVGSTAYALRDKALEVDAFARITSYRLIEVHPEVSFAQMNGTPLPEYKKTWSGSEHRRLLLAAAGINIPDSLGSAGAIANVDDVIDAGAAAWSAKRVHLGIAHCLPENPEVFSDGLASAIWV